MSCEDLQREYYRLAHAMQTGVTTEQSMGDPSGSPKHLRVGVNCAMVEHTALCRVLFAKELISEQEYWEAMVQTMREEVSRFESRLSEATGKNITLH